MAIPQQISAKIMEHLEGITFPASKSQLIDNARRDQGPDTDQVVDFLGRLKKDHYDSPSELMHEVGELE